jgi:hypothetical protein
MARLRYFTVRGSGNFPFQLLSRDECFPASLTEADKIALACPTVAPEQSITLATARGTFTPSAWKEARWPIISSE